MVHTQARKSFRIWWLHDLVGFPCTDWQTLECNWPDITVIDKSKKCLLIDPACPFIWPSHWKERRRKMHKLYWADIWNCKNLENEKGRSYTGSNRSIRNSNKEKLDLDLTSKALQKPCLLGKARIIQKKLDMKWEKKWSYNI